ncbi:uncharacterized protein [Mytilus edulis]|uniref:uncharacterized protein n=1 Tax=Mytilus edulis TaxID=6550 RepID=UPI0039F0A3F3
MYSPVFLLAFLVTWTLCEIVVITKQKDTIYSGHVLFTLYMPMWSLCAQFCSRVQVCKSINFIASNKTCQINDAEPGESKCGLIESTGNSFVAASTFPQNLAGQCEKNDCLCNEACMPRGRKYYCVPIPIKLSECSTREGSLISHKKKTGQSTIFCGKGYLCEPEAGVDGIKQLANIFHTKPELEPFWWVDLGQVYTVLKVVSTNRMHSCCGDRLRKMLIHVGVNLDTCNMELCGQFIGPAISGQVIVTQCNTLPKGHMVKLTSVNIVPRAFHLTEVEVYGVE